MPRKPINGRGTNRRGSAEKPAVIRSRETPAPEILPSRTLADYERIAVLVAASKSLDTGSSQICELGIYDRVFALAHAAMISVRYLLGMRGGGISGRRLIGRTSGRRNSDLKVCRALTSETVDEGNGTIRTRGGLFGYAVRHVDFLHWSCLNLYAQELDDCLSVGEVQTHWPLNPQARAFDEAGWSALEAATAFANTIRAVGFTSMVRNRCFQEGFENAAIEPDHDGEQGHTSTRVVAVTGGRPSFIEDWRAGMTAELEAAWPLAEWTQSRVQSEASSLVAQIEYETTTAEEAAATGHNLRPIDPAAVFSKPMSKKVMGQLAGIDDMRKLSAWAKRYGIVSLSRKYHMIRLDLVDTPTRERFQKAQTDDLV